MSGGRSPFFPWLKRETRGARSRFVFFTLSLAIGTGAVVAVAAIASRFERTLTLEARQLLAADVVVSSRQALPAPVEAVIATKPGLVKATLLELPSVVAVPPRDGKPGPSRLSEVKAVEGPYPFYGTLDLEPKRPLAELLGDDGCVAAPELLAKLGLGVGDRLKLGDKLFTVRGVVKSEPDRLGAAFRLGPRLLVSAAGLRASGLLGFGSRIEYRTLLKLPGSATGPEVETLARDLRAAIPDPAFFRVETFAQGQPELRRGVDRAERFLGLVALLSLLVGGLGVAETVRAWLARRLDAIAIWKTHGLSPREIVTLDLGQAAVLGFAGSAVGAAAGLAVAMLLPERFAALLPQLPLAGASPLAVLRGLALGTGVALACALPPVLAAGRVPAARVLRRDAEPLPPSRLALAFVAAGLVSAVATLATIEGGTIRFGLGFTGGLIAAVGALAGVGWLLRAMARRAPRLRFPISIRHGLGAFARPGAGPLVSAVALGLGVFVVVALGLVGAGLVARLRADLPKEAPSAFLIDIQPAQWAEVQATLASAGATRVDSVPVVMARLKAIDGVDVNELAHRAPRRQDGGGGDRRWALTREQRLTYLDRLPADNEIVAGKLWSGRGSHEVSIEEGFATDLGLHLGSKIRFDVQGIPIELTVTSLRRVRWETFGINFFFVVAPGVLDDAPQMRIAAARLPPGGEQTLQDALAAKLPNVTVFPIRDVLDKVASILSKVAVGVRALAAVAVLSGLAILAGSIAAGALERGREVAIWKAFGMTIRDVATVYATEYAVLGFAAGAIGTLAGSVLAGVVLRRVMEIPWTPPAGPIALALFATPVLAALAGLAASVGPLRARPLETLREL